LAGGGLGPRGNRYQERDDCVVGLFSGSWEKKKTKKTRGWGTCGWEKEDLARGVPRQKNLGKRLGKAKKVSR